MFLLISSLLVAIIYSSTVTHYVSATVTSALGSGCFKYSGSIANVKSCCWVVTDDKGLKIYDSSCASYICGPKNNLCDNWPPKQLRDEKIRDLLQENNILQENDKDTKDSNTDILKDNTTLQENNDNVKEPKAPRIPEDLGSLVHEGR
jgi:hypothetical protein